MGTASLSADLCNSQLYYSKDSFLLWLRYLPALFYCLYYTMSPLKALVMVCSVKTWPLEPEGLGVESGCLWCRASNSSPLNFCFFLY